MDHDTADRIDLKALRCFWSMARHGNLAAAGLELGVSETTARDYVQALESRLDTKLFDTRDGQIVLTSAGRYAVKMTKELFDEAKLAIAFNRHQQT